MRHLYLMLFLFAGWGLAPALRAGQISVTSFADAGPGSLRQALAQAAQGDTVLLPASGVIRLASALEVHGRVAVIGPGAPDFALDGQSLTPIFFLNDSADLILSGVTLRNGYTITGGGAISIQNGRLDARFCHFLRNKARYGGALNIGSAGFRAEALLTGCTFSGNEASVGPQNSEFAPLAGGAVYIDGRDTEYARVIAANCTFSGNSAVEWGGAAFAVGDINGAAQFRCTHCTLTRNEAAEAGALYNRRFASIVFRNSIVAENPSLFAPDFSGYIVSEGYNLFGNAGQSELETAPGDLLGILPELGPLGLNGGSTPVHPLACGSPAADAGIPRGQPADQRGLPRDAAPDLGAAEFDPGDAAWFSLDDSGPGSLRQAVQLACPGAVLTAPNPLTGTIALLSPIRISKDLEISGHALLPLALSGGGATRLLEIAPGVSAAVSWLTLREGRELQYGGGAILNQGRLALRHCTLHDSRSVAGGAIACYGNGDTASVLLEHCTLARNAAVLLDGGALDLRAVTHPASALLVHCTVTENTAAMRGGGFYQENGSSLTLRHCIVAGNSAMQGPDGWGTFTASGVSLIGSLEGISTPSGSLIAGVDPLLDPLDSYGGSTLTCRLQPGSPAIDAAQADPAYPLDQRGFPRVYGSQPDLGAYEFDPATAITPAWNAGALAVHPNPARAQAWLTLPAGFAGAGSLRIVSSAGAVLADLPVSAAPSGRIPLHFTLPAGIYRLILQDADRRWHANLTLLP
ncbi:MAG: right-handed parallel beta-helix repeat-containing protein [Bacteroidia bacterium]|nr:right-handed parallel beta-helix repeat-containing protein [Bacteroidia bacterium]